MSTLALIPAKLVSTEVPDKNFRPIINGLSCTDIAMNVGEATCQRLVFTSDDVPGGGIGRNGPRYYVSRPADLCTPEAPTLAVVRHALECVPGPDDEIVVLLQPTSPLRRLATVRQAIQMLQDDARATSVVSVSPSYPVEWTLHIGPLGNLVTSVGGLGDLRCRRQECRPAYKRDGVVYAFARKTLRDFGSIYGSNPRPLFTPPEESLSIDTPEDWEEAVRRLKARQESDAALSTGNP